MAKWLYRKAPVEKELARLTAALRAEQILVALARVRERRAYVKRMREKRRAWLAQTSFGPDAST